MGCQARKDLLFQINWRSWGNARKKVKVKGISAYVANLSHDKQLRGEQVANWYTILWLRGGDPVPEQVVLDASHWSSWNGDGIVASFILVRARGKQEDRR